MTDTIRPGNPRLRHFRFEHLPPHLQAASKPFGEAAQFVVSQLPDNEQSRLALQWLLLAKDAAVRSLLDGPMPVPAPLGEQKTTD